jgi:two-component system sensor histidine kinase KdpD
VNERVLVLITPEPESQRILRRAWRSAQRLGAALDALWVRVPGEELDDAKMTSLAALRRLAVILGANFLEEEADELVPAVRRVVVERGSTYVFVGTPDESRRREILHGSLVSALVRELPGVDIRVVANRARRRELSP